MSSLRSNHATPPLVSWCILETVAISSFDPLAYPPGNTSVPGEELLLQPPPFRRSPKTYCPGLLPFVEVFCIGSAFRFVGTASFDVEFGLMLSFDFSFFLSFDLAKVPPRFSGVSQTFQSSRHCCLFFLFTLESVSVNRPILCFTPRSELFFFPTVSAHVRFVSCLGASVFPCLSLVDALSDELFLPVPRPCPRLTRSQ